MTSRERVIRTLRFENPVFCTNIEELGKKYKGKITFWVR